MIGTYYRLSLADEDVGADKAESNSIQGQRGLVEGYIMARQELAAEPRQEYVDDGYSGTSTSRPAFQRLIQDAQDGKVKTIIVKDFSRFARDYIEAAAGTPGGSWRCRSSHRPHTPDAALQPVPGEP